ncbi:MAG: hypothetical protein V4550_15615 [Gemmatimonadota bacterium]
MLTTAQSVYARRLRLPGYFILGIATLLPIIDLIVSVWPIRAGTVVWRFGSVGLLSSAVGSPLLLLFFIMALALACGDRKVMVVVAAIAALFALVLVSGMGAFALDALQMKRRVQEGAQPRFLMAAGQAMFKLGVQSIASLILAITTIRSLKVAPKPVPVASTKADARAANTIMGRQSTISKPAAPAALSAAEPAKVEAEPDAEE